MHYIYILFFQIVLSILIIQSIALPNPGNVKKYPKKYIKDLDAIEHKSKNKEHSKSTYQNYKPELKVLVLDPPPISFSTFPASSQALYRSSYASLYETPIVLPPRYLVPPREDTYSVYEETGVDGISPPLKDDKPTTPYTGYISEAGRTMANLTAPVPSSYAENEPKPKIKSKRLLKLMTEKRDKKILLIKPPTKESKDEDSVSSYSSYYTPDQSSYISYKK